MNKKLILLSMLVLTVLSMMVIANLNIEPINLIKDKLPDKIKDKFDFSLVTKVNTLVNDVLSKPNDYLITDSKVYIIKEYKERIIKVPSISKKMVSCDSFLKFGNETCIFGYRYTDVTEYTEIIEHEPIIELVGYESKGNVINKYGLNSGCFIDPLDNDILTCYSNHDGFAENIDNRWKSECKSGTSCYRQRISTDEVISVRSDVGIIN